jgi:hypothetical protein
MKAQIVIDEKKRIICVNTAIKGKKHDFKLLEESNLHIKKTTKIKVDKGYKGIKKLYKNVDIPKKKTKLKKLTKESKKFNKLLSSSRIFVEHVIGKLKVFRILAQKYRNRRKNFNLRVNLISAFVNFDRGFQVVK